MCTHHAHKCKIKVWWNDFNVILAAADFHTIKQPEARVSGETSGTVVVSLISEPFVPLHSSLFIWMLTE